MTEKIFLVHPDLPPRALPHPRASNNDVQKASGRTFASYLKSRLARPEARMIATI